MSTAVAPLPMHRPVMVGEMIEALDPAAGEVFVDGTYGGGGHSRALLGAAACIVWGIDRDPAAVALGRDAEAASGGRLRVIEGAFGDMEALMARHGVHHVDGIALDLGLSSGQLDDPERGFSFQHDGPLDMRMARAGPTAAELVNAASEAELADIIHRFGEERGARRIARAIIRARERSPIRRTGELAHIVAATVRRAPGGVHPATRTFQAIRIWVNNELGEEGELGRGLAAAERLLRPGGRVAVISFHSLEDRQVKRFLSLRAGATPQPLRHLPVSPAAAPAPSFRLISRRVRKPGPREIAANRRARSARLRAAVRTDAPAWPVAEAA